MSLLEQLTKQLQGQNLGELSRAVGADEATTGRALESALPVLLGALQRNSANPDGAEALNRALDKHDGGMLDDLAGFFRKGQTTDGEGILDHVLGSRRNQIESKLDQAAGGQSGLLGKLLPMLAPVVMGALGKEKRQANLDSRGLSEVLGGAQRDVERANPKVGGILTSLLDQDGDGDLDLGDLTKGLLGGLFKR